MRKTVFEKTLLGFLCLSFVSSCGAGETKTFLGTTQRTSIVGSVSFFYSDTFVIKILRGVIDITIATFVYTGNQSNGTYVGRRLISRQGVYFVASSDSSGSTMTLDVPLADAVSIEQTGEGFTELTSDKSTTDIISIDTTKWSSAMSHFGFSSPEEIRFSFGHPSPVSVSISSAGDAVKNGFSIQEYPLIYVPLDKAE